MNIFSTPLNWWQWLLFGIIPPAIVALYFLKLRRQPLEVPSTYLWHRTLEDMHVNSLWQRLRQNLLLFLQLLLVAFLMLACLRPNWQGTQLVEDRAILLIDTSASMSTEDAGTERDQTRLEAAKEQARNVIDRMKPRDVGMVISFSDGVDQIVPFSGDKRLLRRRLQELQPTQRRTDISEALRAAAGLANPGRSGDTGAGDTPVADPLPAAIYIFSDGGFRTVPEFSWGNLQPKYVSLGDGTTPNVGVAAFSAEAVPGRLDKLQALVQVENFGAEPKTVEISLHLEDQLLDATSTTVEPGKIGGADFTFDRPDSGRLRVSIAPNDAFMIDNEAWAVVNPPDRVNILLVSEGNEALETALATEDLQKVTDLQVMAPADLVTEPYKKPAEAGKWNLIIYDDCRPELDPQANTLYLGQIPASKEWSLGETIDVPQIIDLDIAHPLMRYLDFANVTIASGIALQPPTGHRVLMDSDRGPMFVVSPREGFEDAVLGFPLLTTDEQGRQFANTDWPIRLSFPLFVRNAIQYLGGVATIESQPAIQPGQAVAIRADLKQELSVVDPGGRETDVRRGADNLFTFQQTQALGIYEYDVPRPTESGEAATVTRRFAVNLFDSIESNIQPRENLETAWNSIPAQQAFEARRYEAWRWLVLVALGVLVFEWYVYNRRVFL